MKLPEFSNITVYQGTSTLGNLGVALVVLVALGYISAWWLILAVFSILAGVGLETGTKNKS